MSDAQRRIVRKGMARGRHGAARGSTAEDNREDVMALLDANMDQVAQRIADLERLECHLGKLRSCCHEDSVARECGILRGIAHGSGELAAAEPGRC